MKSRLESLVGVPFEYNYDSGDDWWFSVEVTRVLASEGARYPRLVGGAGLAPPEDIGGTPGFERFKRNRKRSKGFDARKMDLAATRLGFEALGGSVVLGRAGGSAARAARRGRGL
jgi:hypothetical protein